MPQKKYEVLLDALKKAKKVEATGFSDETQVKTYLEEKEGLLASAAEAIEELAAESDAQIGALKTQVEAITKSLKEKTVVKELDHTEMLANLGKLVSAQFRKEFDVVAELGSTPQMKTGPDIDWTESRNFKWDKDAVFICEQDINGDVGVEPPMQVQDNMNMLSYLDSDCDEIAGTGRVMRGEPMGGRTSSSEATNAYNAAARPHFMKFRYIFETLFGFYARILRYWQVYGDEQVLIRATGNGRPTTVNPRALRVNYSTHVICVDEYEKNILQQDKFAYAARTMIPLIPPQSMDVVGILIEAFQEVLDWDISKYRLNDNSKAEAAEAKYENGVLEVVVPKAEIAKPKKIQVAIGEHKPETVEATATESAL